jgi:hypothetical protein
MHCSINNLTQVFYASGGQELLQALSADMFDVGAGPGDYFLPPLLLPGFRAG